MKRERLMILLEGNIGAGKTTVGKAIAASGLYGFIEEPTKAWQERFASNMLEHLYRDPARWAFTFQICTFITRAKSWPEIAALTNHSRVVLERSIFCDRFVFVENFYRTGLMTPTEYQLYCGLWEFMTSNYLEQPDMIIYLRTPSGVCLERIRERGREEERGISLEYLLQLERLHDEWLLAGDDPRVLVLDGERRWSTDDVLAEVEAHLERWQSPAR
ncbi:MAG: deoxynucleoside kinase [Anaerolineae bacterium]|nr:deoxynucleoside kinase [Anaerolineae bacterium]